MGKKILLQLLLGVSALGALDAGYLTYEHYAGGIPPCTVNGCEVVLTSPYAEIYGIPIALFGVLFYVSVMITAIALLKKDIPLLKTFLLAATAGGFLFSSYLFYLQAQVLEAFCQYCLVSFGTSTLLFLLSLFIVLKKEARENILTP